MDKLQERIGYQGDLSSIVSKVCEDYHIGHYLSHSVIQVGYQDFNLIVETSNKKFLLKFFSSFRDKQNCERYISIINAAQNAGISQPKLYECRGNNLYEITTPVQSLRLCVMEFIDGKTLFESQSVITEQEVLFLTKQAALINRIPIKPTYDYDSWAIPSFLESWDEKSKYLSSKDYNLIASLVSHFQKLDMQVLPHCFVHGDLSKQNIIRSNAQNLYVLDFSASNIYPRIQDLAVLLADAFFDPENLDVFDNLYNKTINEYQKITTLKRIEIQTLPLYTTLSHAMHLLSATHDKKVNNNDTKENEHYIKVGRIGLEFTKRFFNF